MSPFGHIKVALTVTDLETPKNVEFLQRTQGRNLRSVTKLPNGNTLLGFGKITKDDAQDLFRVFGPVTFQAGRNVVLVEVGYA